ncbi:hypothetical protein A4A49_64881, partial [Nicotiana attenuata]
LWFQPECTGSGSDGQVGPSPRAFHVAVSIDCHMFIFGGRSGNRRLGDFWVLDTGKDFFLPWLCELLCKEKCIIIFYFIFSLSLDICEKELSVLGTLPPPRCGHTSTMVEKRLLVYGGRGKYG